MKVKLLVPAEWTDQFKRAAASEVANDADAVAENARAIPRIMAADDRPGTGVEDLRGSVGFLNETLDVLSQAFTGRPEQYADLADPVAIEADPSAIAHISETMIREVVLSQLRDELDVTPLDSEAKQDVARLSRALDWATDVAVEHHALAHKEIAANKPTPLYKLCLGPQVNDALDAAGFQTLEAIAERTEAEIAAINGVGSKAIEGLRAALAARGLSFADNKKGGRS